MKRLSCALFLLLLVAMPATADQSLILEAPIPIRGTPQFQKLDRGLNRILLSDDAEASAKSLGYRLRDGKIQIVAAVAESEVEELEAWLTQNGAVHVSSAANYIQAFVPLDVLPALDHDPSVSSVRRPDYIDVGPEPKTTDAVKLLTYTSEGLQAMNAQAWHSAGYSGQGLKIGVIDGGFMGVDPLLGVELPDESRVWGQSFGGTNFYGSKHGTACAEIVYDLAPDVSQLYLAATSTVIDMVNAGAWLDSMGVDIITMSMGFGLGSRPGDGSGPLADLIDLFVDGGGLVVIAAGNSGDNHWQGSWSDQNSNGALNFATDSEINYIVEDDGVTPRWVPAFSTVEVTLVWNQWQRPTTDLDSCVSGLVRLDRIKHGLAEREVGPRRSGPR
jgi:subtilisin family serine protease